MATRQDEQKELRLAEYWDARYAGTDAKQEGEHEWFRTFDDLRPFLLRSLPAAEDSVSIVHLGCGTSTLPADLYHAGYKNQSSIDFSSIAIAAMKEKYAALTELDWRVMDVRKMEYESASFNIAIDKGTLDAMLYGSLWTPEDQVLEDSKAYVDEVLRILKPSGKWLYVTYRQPHFMKKFLTREGLWELEVENLGGSDGTFAYFAFVMTKRPD